jgi:hypothetical protein
MPKRRTKTPLLAEKRDEPAKTNYEQIVDCSSGAFEISKRRSSSQQTQFRIRKNLQEDAKGSSDTSSYHSTSIALTNCQHRSSGVLGCSRGGGRRGAGGASGGGRRCRRSGASSGDSREVGGAQSSTVCSLCLRTKGLGSSVALTGSDAVLIDLLALVGGDSLSVVLKTWGGAVGGTSASVVEAGL